MRMSLWIAVLAVCGGTVAAGLVEGRLSNRWGEPADLVSAAERVAQVPEQFGDWKMQSSRPFDEDTLAMLQCAGHFTRVYVNSLTGDTISMALLVGPTGPTAIHTPEVCYSSRNQTIIESPTEIATRPKTVPGETLWRMTFRANDPEQALQRVFYGWAGTDGHWRAAKDPRYEYGGEPLLYKIQLASGTTQQADKEGSDPCRRFLQDFLPVVDATLFGTARK